MAEEIVWRVLCVDDDEYIGAQVKDYLSSEIMAPGSRTEVETLNNFEGALATLESQHFDILILDVRLGRPESDIEADDEAGPLTLRSIQEKRFLPVIFYTGLPQKVEHLQSSLIKVVEKTEGVGTLFDKMKDIFETGLPEVNRAILRHVQQVQRDYMWNFVGPQWQKISATEDRAGLAYLLARRLAMSLSGPNIQELMRALGASSAPAPEAGKVHPMQYYIMPAINATLLAGDIMKFAIGENTEYWIVLTPSCDLEQKKAEYIKFARCVLLNDQKEYVEFMENKQDGNIRGRLKGLLTNNRQKVQADRFHYLPGTLYLPHLVIDFQQTRTLPLEDVNVTHRVASLDSPFAEAVVVRYTRYTGRLGTPDIDVDGIMGGLT